MMFLYIFEDNYEQGLNYFDFCRVLFDVLKFLLNYLNFWLEKNDIEWEMLKVVWYGDVMKSQFYFLYYFMLVGCDVLLFYLVGNDQLVFVDLKQEFSFMEKFLDVLEFQLFLKEKLDWKLIVVYCLIKEIEYVLNYEEFMLYKLW